MTTIDWSSISFGARFIASPFGNVSEFGCAQGRFWRQGRRPSHQRVKLWSPPPWQHAGRRGHRTKRGRTKDQGELQPVTGPPVQGRNFLADPVTRCCCDQVRLSCSESVPCSLFERPLSERKPKGSSQILSLHCKYNSKHYFSQTLSLAADTASLFHPPRSSTSRPEAVTPMSPLPASLRPPLEHSRTSAYHARVPMYVQAWTTPHPTASLPRPSPRSKTCSSRVHSR